jgi:hypothetical protein
VAVKRVILYGCHNGEEGDRAWWIGLRPGKLGSLPWKREDKRDEESAGFGSGFVVVICHVDADWM